ncbi:MAG: DUF4350 domain-containing protein [Gammaproteobacteria bacterium]|nr:MAG: DUF4350 domain-containing protein [Gammaproteobacteria bacterium]
MLKFSSARLIALVVILLGIFLVYYSLKDYELIERERYNGFSSQVVQGRYSILQEFLKRMDMDVKRHIRVTSIKELRSNQGTMFLGILPDRYSEDEIKAILGWVEQGGHLIINAEIAKYYYDEVVENSILNNFNISREYIPYDDRVESDATAIKLSEKTYELAYGYEHTAISISEPDRLISSDDNSQKFIQIKYKKGLVSVFSSTEFLMNNQIIENDHALFSYDLFSLNNPEGKVWLVEQPRMPHFTDLIWDYYRNVVISCGVLLLFFLIWLGRRFGAIITDENTYSRSLIEQIHAAGIFAVKTKSLNSLVVRVRKDLRRKIERKHPSIAFDSDCDVIGEIAKITHLDRKDVEFAFNYKMAHQQIEFLNIIKALHKIGKLI